MLPYQYHLTTIESLSSHTAVKEQFPYQNIQVILGNEKWYSNNQSDINLSMVYVESPTLQCHYSNFRD